MDTIERIEREINDKVKGSNAREGKVASMLESQTAKIPSDFFLWAAFSSMAASLTLKFMKRDTDALFVGQWAPSFLLLGVYNKLVKQLGHDRA